MASGALPDCLLAHVFSFLPLDERVKLPPSVCRQWRRAATEPSRAWADLQFKCRSLEAWHGLMRWLRRRMPAVQRLSLKLYASHDETRRQRFANRCATSLRVLGARLASAPQLHTLSLSWDLLPRHGSDSQPPQPSAKGPAQLPLNTAALLPLPKHRARRARPPLPLHLSSLELSCRVGVVLSPALNLLPVLRHLSIGTGWYRFDTGGHLRSGPSPADPAWLPSSLTALTLSATAAVASLAECGPRLAAALPTLRELRMPVSPDVCGDDDGDEESVYLRLGVDAAHLLEGLLPLAGQLQCLELPPRCLPPPVLSRFTALRTLRAPSQPAELPEERESCLEVWDSIFFHLSRLHTLDISLLLGSDGYNPEHQIPHFPLPLASLPGSLRALRVCSFPGVDLPLPAGEYLQGLTRLCLCPNSALRLAPLLPFMPELAHLTVENESEMGTVRNPRSSGSGDEALDAAAAAAAALSDSTATCADELAAGLARHPCFRTLRLMAAGDEWVPQSAMRVALKLQRRTTRVEVEVGEGWGSEGESKGGEAGRDSL